MTIYDLTGTRNYAGWYLSKHYPNHRSKDKLEIEATVTQKPAKKGQQVEYVKGAKLDVTGYEARGRARYQLRPARAVPASGEVEVLATMTLAKDGKNDKSLALLTRSTYTTPKP